MTMRTCSVCGKEKHPEDFSAGHGRCRACDRADASRNRRTKGSQATTFTRAEVLWLRDAINKMLVATQMHGQVMSPIYPGLARKVHAMARRSNEAVGKPNNVYQLRGKAS